VGRIEYCMEGGNLVGRPQCLNFYMAHREHTHHTGEYTNLGFHAETALGGSGLIDEFYNIANDIPYLQLLCTIPHSSVHSAFFFSAKAFIPTF